MAIPTSRTKENANIIINETICKGCGLCVEVCQAFNLVLENGKACVSKEPVFGCPGCGHCMAVCPTGAIKIEGRTLSPEDIFVLPDSYPVCSYEPLLNLLQRRRSIREFKAVPVEKELIEKILEAAKSAPMGLPPSDVNVLVLETTEKVRNFAEDFCSYLKGMRWFVSKWFLTLMRPFWGKANDELFREFVRPVFHFFIESMRNGLDFVTYDAPVAMYFYGTPYSHPAAPIIAATYAMIAAESLGLGTCMIGSIHPMIQYGKRAERFRQKYGIQYKSREGIFVIMGYAKIKFHKGIRRTFASVNFYNTP